MSMSTDGDGYRLMRDSASSCRLNAQHYLWKQICGFNLHPRIPAEVDKALKIADIGTGTGIWLIDLQPGTAFQVDGFDLSLAQCPPPELCPLGCSMQLLDIQTKSLPENLKNSYDILNVRLIQGGLQNDPVPALKNIMAMLKPGGYLQWQEINLNNLSIATSKEGLEQSNMKELLDEVHHFGFGKWTSRLADICTETGFLESKTDTYHVSPQLAIPWCQTQFGAYTEVSRVSMDNSTPDSKGPKFRALVERAYAELNKGVWLMHRLEVTVAKKPN